MVPKNAFRYLLWIWISPCWSTQKNHSVFFLGNFSSISLPPVVAGRFPVTRELAAELGALMAQLDMGDYSPSNTTHNQPRAHRFYPYRYRAGLSNDELR